MNKEIKLDARVGVSFDVKDATELNQMAEKLSKINKNIKGVGAAREEQARLVSAKMKALALEGQQKYASGEFGKNPEARKAFEKEMINLKTQYYKLTNQIAGAYTKSLAKTKEEEKALEEINKQMSKKQVAIKNNISAMEELAKKTATFRYEREKLSKRLGIEEGQISTVEGVDEQIARRVEKDGAPKKGQDKTVEGLKQYRQELVKINKENKDWEEKQVKLSNAIEDDYHELSKIRGKRVEIIEQIIKAAKEQNNISDEEADTLRSLVKEEKIREDIADAAERTKAAETSQQVKENIKKNKELADTNGRVRQSFLHKVTAATLYYAALRTVRRIMSSLISTIKELDQSLTEVAMVTGMNREEAWGLVDSYQNLAYEVGATTHEIARLSVYFFRQGRTAADALELTRVAATAAKVASIDVMESANYLTSAINGFGLAADKAMEVSDRFAALAASSASSYEEMAVALSKVAPSANVAGVSIDQMMGFLAKGIETTREAPENIGTAFKTIFARMTQLKDFGKTLEEGVSVNTVEEALKLAGVALRDEMGTFREMGDVLMELGGRWDGLGRNQQAYIATALAGTRQQSRLLAVMQDFDRTMELVNTSTESAGATLAQHAEYAGGMEAANARLTTAWEQLILAFSDSDVIIGAIEAMASGLSHLARGAKAFTWTLSILTIASTAYLLVTNRAIVSQKLHAILKTIHIGLNYKQAASLKAVTLAMAGATLGISLLVAGIWSLVGSWKDSETAAKKVSEQINQLKVDLYNVNKEIDDLSSLVDTFDRLDSKIFKTNEELEEMQSILEKINEYGGNQYDFVLAGQLDKAAIDAYLEAKAIEKREKTNELRNIGRTVAHQYQDNSNFRANLEQRSAFVEFMASTISDNYDDLTEREQERIKLMISNNYDYYVNTYSDYLNRLDEELGSTNTQVGEGIQSTIAPFSDIQYDEQKIKENTFELISKFEEYFSDASSDIDTVKLFENFFSLTDDEKAQVTNAFKAELGDILNLGEGTIRELVGIGYSIENMQNIASGIETAFDGISRINPDDAWISEGAGPIMMERYMDLISDVEPGDTMGMLNALETLILELEDAGLSADDAQKATQRLLDTFTDTQAFQNGVNNAKSIASSYSSIMDAFDKYQSGEIADNLDELLVEYPDLMEKFIDGSLTENDVFTSLTEGFESALNENIEQLRTRLLGVQDEVEREIINNQIKILQDMLTDSEFLAKGMKDAMIKDVENIYGQQISYLQDINSERQQELDMIQRKLDMNKSMLELDRQIMALQRDTSYGAQARLRSLQEQRQTQALEREKFVMDLVTEQQISQLEKERDEAIKDIRGNVELIAEKVTGVRVGGGSGNVKPSFNAHVGITLNFE